jgi:hypothetical protein
VPATLETGTGAPTRVDTAGLEVREHRFGTPCGAACCMHPPVGVGAPARTARRPTRRFARLTPGAQVSHSRRSARPRQREDGRPLSQHACRGLSWHLVCSLCCEPAAYRLDMAQLLPTHRALVGLSCSDQGNDTPRYHHALARCVLWMYAVHRCVFSPAGAGARPDRRCSTGRASTYSARCLVPVRRALHLALACAVVASLFGTCAGRHGCPCTRDRARSSRSWAKVRCPCRCVRTP